jgi:hypothetical protein
MPMTRVGRARERGETQGFMKVLVDAESERILGASLLCIEGDEIVHMLLAAMAGDLSYKVIERAVHIHPTVSELIRPARVAEAARPGLTPWQTGPTPSSSASPALTLGHYDASAEAFWEGTRDHDVRQNVAALLRHLEGPGPFAILDLGCGPGSRPRHLPRPRSRGDRRRRRGALRRDGARAERLRGLAAEPARARAARGALRRHLRQRGAAARAGERAAARAAGAARDAEAARRAVQLDPARPRRGGLEQPPLQRLPRAGAWQRHGAEAGFVELEHFYGPRPAARAAAVARERLAARRRPQGALIRVTPPRVST